MFEFLAGTNRTSALAGVHFAVGRITHRQLFDQQIARDQEELHFPNLESTDRMLGLKIISEIEEAEGRPLSKLSLARAQAYKEKLASLAQDLATPTSNSERGRQLLQEWRRDPLKDVQTISIPQPSPRLQIIFVGSYLPILTLACLYLLIQLWPGEIGGGWEAPVRLLAGTLRRTISPDLRLMLLSMAAGGLGACVQALTSFSRYLRNSFLNGNWLWLFLLQPLVGMGLVLIFYFTVRGGFMSTTATPQDLNIFGIVALSGLLGMFSHQATNKLNEVMATIFARRDNKADVIPKE